MNTTMISLQNNTSRVLARQQSCDEHACACEQVPVNNTLFLIQEIQSLEEAKKNWLKETDKELNRLNQLLVQSKATDARAFKKKQEDAAAEFARQQDKEKTDFDKANKANTIELISTKKEELVSTVRKTFNELAGAVAVDSSNKTREQKSRAMKGVIPDNELISHHISLDDNVWIGTYNLALDTIECNGIHYDSPSAFAKAHQRTDPSQQDRTANGWIECKHLENGKWKSLTTFRK